MPLQHALRFLWMKLFGFNLLAVRALDYLLVATATALTWLTTRRLDLIQRSSGRILFVLLLLLGYGTSIGARGSRYDGITILLASLSPVRFRCERPRCNGWRWSVWALCSLGPDCSSRRWRRSLVRCSGCSPDGNGFASARCLAVASRLGGA